MSNNKAMKFVGFYKLRHLVKRKQKINTQLLFISIKEIEINIKITVKYKSPTIQIFVLFRKLNGFCKLSLSSFCNFDFFWRLDQNYLGSKLRNYLLIQQPIILSFLLKIKNFHRKISTGDDRICLVVR